MPNDLKIIKELWQGPLQILDGDDMDINLRLPEYLESDKKFAREHMGLFHFHFHFPINLCSVFNLLYSTYV